MEFITDHGLLAICTAAVVLVLSIVFYFKCIRTGPKVAPAVRWARGKREVVLFIDAPDPDNPASAAAIIKHVTSEDDNPHLHIVLTGRKIDFNKTSKHDLFKQGNSIVRQPWEKNQPLHARKLLQDAAARLSNYLAKCNVKSSMVTIYDGGVAPRAPISDRAHDWDFLFDRKDLITKVKTDKGNILFPEEYQQLVDDFSGMEEEERAEQILDLLRTYTLAPLGSLKRVLEKGSCSEIVLFLGGPATALVQLFEGVTGSRMREKVSGLYGMFGALSPGKRTLFPNQFNVACDIEAASDLFVSNLFPQAEKYLVTTETAKSGAVMVSSENLEAKGIASYFVDLQKLWESTHKGTTQPMFDILPVMAFTTQYRGCFKWSRKKAVLEELQRREVDVVQVFCFADSDDDRHMFVSEASLDNFTREDFLMFLKKTWT